MWQNIGELTLNFTTLIYFIWFLPQLLLTFKNQTISALSFGMHTLLLLGYLGDLIYGFGLELPLQYKMVTISGLLILMLEHYQFWVYHFRTSSQKMLYYAVSILLLLLTITGFGLLKVIESESFFNAIGIFTIFCWVLFAVPQLWKNFTTRSVEGISKPSIWLSLVTGAGDIISAFALAWSWPNKLGALIGLIPKCILLLQCYYYKRSERIYESC
jgi:uncharacterized protein with PQ loop repeat